MSTEGQVSDRRGREIPGGSVDRRWKGGRRRRVQKEHEEHPSVVTPIPLCDWTTGWPSHTYRIQVRDRVVLNVVSPIEQCREEAGLHSSERC